MVEAKRPTHSNKHTNAARNCIRRILSSAPFDLHHHRRRHHYRFRYVPLSNGQGEQSTLHSLSLERINTQFMTFMRFLKADRDSQASKASANSSRVWHRQYDAWRIISLIAIRVNSFQEYSTPALEDNRFTEFAKLTNNSLLIALLHTSVCSAL